LALVDVDLGLFTGKFLSSASNRESVLVEQTTDLADEDDVLALIIASITAALQWLETWKLLLPVAQDMRLNTAELTDFANGKIPLARNRRELSATYRRFQHRLPLLLLVFDRVETSRHGAP